MTEVLFELSEFVFLEIALFIEEVIEPRKDKYFDYKVYLIVSYNIY